jgi:hypothetical protein
MTLRFERGRPALLFVLLVAVGGVVGALRPMALAAQEDHSIFTVLNTGGRTVAVGSSAEGTLSSDDPLAGDGHRVQVWVLRATPGQDLRVELRGSGFDAHLQVVGPGLGSGLTDDDGGYGLDSRLCFTVPEGGETRLVASALNGGVGSFFLDVSESTGDGCSADDASGAIDPMELPTDGRRLRVGYENEGLLSTADARGMNPPMQAWILMGEAGATASVDLRSNDFDAFLTLIGPGLDVLTDDDSAGRCDSRLTVTFPESAEYRVVVGTLGVGSGDFVLSASVTPGPVDPEPCIPSSTESEPDAGRLGEVPVAGSIPLEGAVDGTLTGSEVIFRGSPVQAWTLQGSAGDRVAITSTSADMDGYLFFTGPGFSAPVTDDDSGGGLDPRICVELPEDGTYTIFPGRLGEQGPGSRYHLEVTVAGADDVCDEYSLSEGRLTEALLAMDTRGRVLEVGREASGVLSVDDETHPSDGTPIQAWSLVAPPGSTVWVDEVSNDFDPLIRVLSAAGDEVTSDDFDEGWNSRVEVTVPVDGRLLVLAGAFSGDGQGAFLLRVSTDPPPLEVNTGGGGGAASVSSRVDIALLEALIARPEGALTVGTEVQASLGDDDVVLDDGNRAQAWSFPGQAGAQVILVATSDDFDAMLYLAGPGLGDPLSNDDGGPGLGSRLEVRLPETGTYTVVVGALSEGVGGYQLYLLRPAGD